MGIEMMDQFTQLCPSPLREGLLNGISNTIHLYYICFNLYIFKQTSLSKAKEKEIGRKSLLLENLKILDQDQQKIIHDKWTD